MSVCGFCVWGGGYQEGRTPTSGGCHCVTCMHALSLLTIVRVLRLCPLQLNCLTATAEHGRSGYHVLHVLHLVPFCVDLRHVLCCAVPCRTGSCSCSLTALAQFTFLLLLLLLLHCVSFCAVCFRAGLLLRRVATGSAPAPSRLCSLGHRTNL
jgi:hypothetical protein